MTPYAQTTYTCGEAPRIFAASVQIMAKCPFRFYLVLVSMIFFLAANMNASNRPAKSRCSVERAYAHSQLCGPPTDPYDHTHATADESPRRDSYLARRGEQKTANKRFLVAVQEAEKEESEPGCVRRCVGVCARAPPASQHRLLLSALRLGFISPQAGV